MHEERISRIEEVIKPPENYFQFLSKQGSRGLSEHLPYAILLKLRKYTVTFIK
jgi:hypothetical protein